MEVPKIICDLIRRKQLRFSKKALQALYTGRYSIADLRQSILNGTVNKKEKDETKEVKYKYVIIGSSESGERIYSAGKITTTVTGKKYFIITFHEADKQ